jgi:hypothetical protein
VKAEVVFTRHAAAIMEERGIRTEWVERVLGAPEAVEVDPGDPSLRRAFGRIVEFGGRVLRVVYHETEGQARVVTVFFDRNRLAGQWKGQP